MIQSPRRGTAGVAAMATLAFAAIVAAIVPKSANAIGEASQIDVRGVLLGDGVEPRPTARPRLAWELRKRTSIDPRLAPTQVRLDDPDLLGSPLLYWAGEGAFPALSTTELAGLRRFVSLGGFLIIDNAAPESREFDESVRDTLARAFPSQPLHPLPDDHTIYRSFYLVSRPVGRVEGPPFLEGIERSGRVAIVYSRHDLGGAWARDNLGTYLHAVSPGGEEQREFATRLGVNLVMYALCLDYKDDQVHVPFILRRRGGHP